MDSYEWNKIFGWLLAAAIAVLALGIVTGFFFHDERPEQMAFIVDVPEVAVAGEEEADPMIELATSMQSAEIARGENVFKKCATCHTIAQGGANKQGPNLYGIVGRDIGSYAGFGYSEALQNEPGAWTFEKLNGYIANPRTSIPGNQMSFAGISKARDRADLFVYLNTQGSNEPLPAVPALPLAGDDPEDTGPEAAKAEDVPEAELSDAAAVPESNIGGPAAENQDTTDETARQ